MIVQCDTCNTKFRLDDSKIKDKGVRVRCTKCQNVFTVMPPTPEATPPEAPSTQEETFEVSFGVAQEPAQKAPTTDFSSFTEEPQPSKQKEKAEQLEWGVGGPDLSSEEKPKEETKSEWDIGFQTTPPKEEPAFSFGEKKEPPQPETSEFSFKIGEEPAISFETEKKEAPKSEEMPGFGLDQGFVVAPHAEKVSFEVEPSPSEEEFVIHPKEEAKTVVMQPPKVSVPFPDISEKTLFEAKMSEEKDIAFEVPQGGKSIVRRILIILAIILLLGGGAGVLYLNIGAGFLDKITGMIGGKKMPSQPLLDIVGLHGFYVDNPSAGRLFLIEGKVVSNSSEPKEVNGIHGIIFDKSGKQLKDTWVAPGRVLSRDEVKGITASELGKRFREKKGIIPAKGTVPFMLVFQGISDELAEFSVELSQ